MVFEEIFRIKWSEKRLSYSLMFGVAYTIIAFITSLLIFKETPNFIGISTILLTVVLIIPTINKIFDKEEKKEAKEKLIFFLKHEHIVDFFIYFFIGVFIVFFIIALIYPQYVFSENQLHNIQANVDTVKNAGNLPPPPIVPGENEILSIFKNNFNVFVLNFSFPATYIRRFGRATCDE